MTTSKNEFIGQQKIRLTIKPPRCKACRERAMTGELEDILGIIKATIKNRLGTGIPIVITIKKKPPKKK